MTCVGPTFCNIAEHYRRHLHRHDQLHRRVLHAPVRPPPHEPHFRQYASGRVGGGVAPAASHRSGRAPLRHPARPVADSHALRYPWSSRGQLIEVRCPRAVARPRPRDEVPPSLPRVLAARVPRLQRYYGALRFPAVLAVPLRCLRETVPTPCACVRRSAQARRRLGARGVRVRPPPRPVVVEAETVGRPKFLGAPTPVCPVQSTPAGPRAPDQYGAAAWPLVCVKQRLPRKVFRRSIAGRSGSLSTLRRLGYPSRRKTRFQPLVRRYWAGFYPQGPYGRFQSVSLHLILLPQALLGANTSTAASGRFSNLHAPLPPRHPRPVSSYHCR